MAASRSTRDLINMIKANKNNEVEDYPMEGVEKLPTFEKDPKITYADTLGSKTNIRASTGHLRNLSTYDRASENIELPNIKSAQRNSALQMDLEKKLKKLKNLSQNDKEMIDIQRK